VAKNLYLGTANGVFTLSPENGGWKVDSQSLQDWAVHALAVDPSNPDRVLAATRGDGVWLSEDRGVHWKKPSYSRRGPGKARSIAFDPRDSRRILVGAEPIDVFVSDDLGQHWDRLELIHELEFVPRIGYPVATMEPHVRDVAIDPRDSNTLHVALQVGAIIKSTDGGRSWTHVEKGLDSDVHTIVLNADDPDVIVIATGGGESRSESAPGRALYRSADGGVTWSAVAMDFTQEYSMPLTPSPADPRTLYASLAHGAPPRWNRPSGAEAIMVRSQDGGQGWQRLEIGGETLHDFPAGIAVDPVNPDNVYACLDSGILNSHDGGESWRKQDLTFPRCFALQCS
jgi:photosystem II stability/assembly factor-like uncharacterized protein